MDLPEPPARGFASDNFAGVHPRVLDAIAAANHGHAMAYGDDEITRRCEAMVDELFGRPVSTFFTFNGTGANVMALMALARPGDAVICSDWAHIHVDETAAPERVVGVKLLDVAAPGAKLTPDHLDQHAHAIGVTHHAQPAIVSITQSTELGTLYTADEIGALCAAAHAMGMRVHLDGARIANAVAASGGTVDVLRAMTIDAGVDVMSFGGTKNGLMCGEAVVFLDAELGARGHFVRKNITQLPSKMRFIAAQFEALLTDDLWLALAGHSNAMAARLYDATRAIEGVQLDGPPAVNSLFPVFPAGAIPALQAWSFFWDWDVAAGQARWMTAWDTTVDDVERFAAGVAQIVDAHNNA